MTADMTTVAANDAIPSPEAIGDRMRRMPEKVSESYRTRLGTYRGLECGLILHPLGGTEVYLDGVARTRETLMRDNPGPRAVLNALDRIAKGYGQDCDRLRRDIAVKQGQLKDYQSRLGKPFTHADYMSQLADLRDRLKLGLSVKQEEEGPSVAEVAEQIKALRSANVIDASPQRAGVKKSAAETPVTARIKRAEEPTLQEATPQEAVPEPQSTPIPEPTPEPEPNFAHRIVQGRKPVQLSLF